jgi:hypothetical protein
MNHSLTRGISTATSVHSTELKGGSPFVVNDFEAMRIAGNLQKGSTCRGNMDVSMPKTIDEAEAKKITLEYVKKQESGAQAEIKSVERQDIWVLEVSWAMQTEKTKGTQYANVTVSGTGEVRDYEKTRFQSGSVSQRITSKLRSIFSRKSGEKS